MLNRCQFLRIPMPPSAAAESSKEVKLRKMCGRPILWCGGGTRIHNFFRLAIFFVWQYLWGRGEHDPSRHLSPDRRTRMGRRKISSTLLNTLMCGEIGRISRVGSFAELEVLSSWKFCRQKWCQVLTRVKFCYRWKPPPPSCIMNYRLRYKNIAYNAGEFTR